MEMNWFPSITVNVQEQLFFILRKCFVPVHFDKYPVVSFLKIVELNVSVSLHETLYTIFIVKVNHVIVGVVNYVHCHAAIIVIG